MCQLNDILLAQGRLAQKLVVQFYLQEGARQCCMSSGGLFAVPWCKECVQRIGELKRPQKMTACIYCALVYWEVSQCVDNTHNDMEDLELYLDDSDIEPDMIAGPAAPTEVSRFLVAHPISETVLG